MLYICVHLFYAAVIDDAPTSDSGAGLVQLSHAKTSTVYDPAVVGVHDTLKSVSNPPGMVRLAVPMYTTVPELSFTCTMYSVG